MLFDKRGDFAAPGAGARVRIWAAVRTGAIGQSRRPGSRNKATRAVAVVLDGEPEGLTRKAVTAALARDRFAMKLNLERLLPRCRCLPLPSRLHSRMARSRRATRQGS